MVNLIFLKIFISHVERNIYFKQVSAFLISEHIFSILEAFCGLNCSLKCLFI